MALLNISANDLPDTQSDFEPIPAGQYAVEIVASAIKETKKKRDGLAKKGSYLDLQLKLIEGHPQNEVGGRNYGGRTLFAKYTLDNDNQKAVEIGQGQLKQLMGALGMPDVKDSEQMHNRPFVVKVVVKKDSQHGDSNEVKGAKPLPGGAATQTQGPASSSAGPAWAR